MARGGVNDGADAALAHYARESHPWSPGDGASATTVARFRSAPARLAPDDACAVSVVEDVAAFAGGPVWRIDWCPERPADGGGGAYLAVEAGGGRGAGGCEDGSEIDGAAVRPSSNLHATSFDELGRVSGAGVVQIWRLRAAAAEDGAAGGAAGGKRKRFGQPTRNESNEISSDRGAPANGGGSEARCVLCLAHDGGVAWDLRWSPVRPSDGGGGGTAGGGALGTLAVALGDGRVEAWTVDDPEGNNDLTTTESSNPGVAPRVVQPRRILRGVVPRECGVALALDWSHCGRKIAAACSGGAVCVWDVTAVRTGDGERATLFPSFVIGDDARRPQRCVAWVPPDASDDEGGALEGGAQMDGRLIASAGHGMAAPAVYSLDDPFKPVVGARGLTFSGAGAVLSMDWPRTAGAAAVTGSADGTVRLHDFFSKRSVHARRGDTADTSNSKAVAWGTSTSGKGAKGVGAGGRSRSRGTDKEHEMSVRGVWCVATKPVGTSGVALVCVGTGAAGCRVASVHAGHGARRTNGRNKQTAIATGAPVDLVPLGGHVVTTRRGDERVTDGGGSGDASTGTTLTAFGQRTTRGPGSLGGDAAVVAAVRCARWLEPNAAVVAGSGEDAWLAWGDDAGFVRFQRISTRGLLDVVAPAMEKLATMN